MGTTESWIENRDGVFYYVIENDGPRVLRHGLERKSREVVAVERRERTYPIGFSYAYWAILFEDGRSWDVSDEDGETIKAAFDAQRALGSPDRPPAARGVGL
jgi:hypothetical protein